MAQVPSLWNKQRAHATRKTLCIDTKEGRDAAGMGLSRIVTALSTILIKSLLENTWLAGVGSQFCTCFVSLTGGSE